MMPWEHVAVGYVAYSLFVHAIYRDSPTGTETLAVVFTSLLPDLIDKPLAWQLGVFDGGYALGHSVFFAVPLVLAVGLIARSREQPRVGWAFGIGYLLHFPADVIPSYFLDGDLSIHHHLWPIGGGGSSHGSFFAGFMDNFGPYALWAIEELASGDPSPLLLFLLGLATLTFLLWLYDGLPVAREGYLWMRRAYHRLRKD